MAAKTSFHWKNLRIFPVELNGRMETAVIKRVEGEVGKQLPMEELPHHGIVKKITIYH